MIANDPVSPRSLEKLKQRGDKMMADAHQTVADARRLAIETAELLGHTERLHDELHGQP